jgi:hypothetical protein
MVLLSFFLFLWQNLCTSVQSVSVAGQNINLRLSLAIFYEM